MAIISGLPPFASAVLALAFVLTLVWLAARLAPRFLSPALISWPKSRDKTARLFRHETLVLGPRHRLHLVRCDQREVLLLTGGPQDLVVGWLAEAGDR